MWESLTDMPVEPEPSWEAADTAKVENFAVTREICCTRNIVGCLGHVVYQRSDRLLMPAEQKALARQGVLRTC